MVVSVVMVCIIDARSLDVAYKDNCAVDLLACVLAH